MNLTRTDALGAFARTIAARLGAQTAWICRVQEIADVLPLFFEGCIAEEAPLQLVESLGGQGLGVSDLAAMGKVARKRGERVLERRVLSPAEFGRNPACLNTLLVAENSHATFYGMACCGLGAHASFETFDLMLDTDEAPCGLGVIALSADAERTRPGISEAVGDYACKHVPSETEADALLEASANFDACMRARCDHAAVLAAFLAAHPRVGDVSYPGLNAHPCHQLAANTLRGGYGAWVEYTPIDETSPARILARLDDPKLQCAELEAQLASIPAH